MFSKSATLLLAAKAERRFVRSGLKKVTDDMKTHKNPKLRQSAAPYKKPVAAKPTPVAKPKPAGPVRTPTLQLAGKKWIVVRLISATLNSFDKERDYA